MMSVIRTAAGRLAAGAALPLAVASALLTAPAAQAETIYTLAEVHQHATASDCWSAVNGGVYNLTSWIPRHPGGSSVILAMCGLDGSASFNGQHSGGDGENDPAAALAQYRIGALDPTPPPTPTTTYTMAQVATHNTAGNCWSAISGGVYNLTSWVPQHPGGAGVITALCGVDGTASFQGKHSASPGANSALAQLKIGTLSGTSTPPPAPTPTTTYTLAQVATHNTAGNCWSAISGGVYDLTSWVSQHPGGAGVITALCGVDGTASFQGKHSASPGANSALAQLKIGTLSGTSTPPPTANGTYTLAQVATHNTAGNCWSAISGGVYNLTSWVSQHPGGAGVITALCGVDGTASFQGKHSASPGANSALAQFRIGTLIASTTPLPNGTYTMAQVATHSTAGDCWSAVGGSVYSLTSWIPQHPGGQAAITAMCGMDATASFVGKHAGSAGANAALAQFRIGTLIASTTPLPNGTYTLEQVAAHSTAADCWSAVAGGVYNLTAWIPKHPGGQAAITAMCGTDATASFVGKHAGSAGANAALAQYKIGTLIASAATASTPAAPTTTAANSATRHFTMKQVSSHRTAANCWSVVNRSVYNLTPWTKAHPRRTASIKRMCGRNATKSYVAGHGGAAHSARILKRYRIGVLGAVRRPPRLPLQRPRPRQRRPTRWPRSRRTTRRPPAGRPSVAPSTT